MLIISVAAIQTVELLYTDQSAQHFALSKAEAQERDWSYF
jgi:hypothetical protein